MKKIFLILMLLPSIVQASNYLECYSGARQIYHGYGKILVKNDDGSAFKDAKTKKYIVTNGICILFMDKLK